MTVFTFDLALSYDFRILYMHTAIKEWLMSAAKKQRQQEWKPMPGIERLNLRVSNMINHPIAQDQRWVTIHRLDTDGEREWDEVMGVLSEVDGIEMTFNDEDESITLRWEASTDDDHQVEAQDEFMSVEEPAPF